MTTVQSGLRAFVAERLVSRNPASRAFFERESPRLAVACQEMARRFTEGGRLLAFGRGAGATDAQHVTVEFIHPVIVGKRALPALDLSSSLAAVPALVRDVDIAIGFSPEDDEECGNDGREGSEGTDGRDGRRRIGVNGRTVAGALRLAAARGAQTFALSGRNAHYAIAPPSRDPFVAQELVEILYHTLWETVHVFFEHGARSLTAGDGGAAAFLYPFLATGDLGTSHLLDGVAASIRAKAAEDERLRARVAEEQVGAIAEAIAVVRERLQRGATLLMFGNGGSATDANDWVFDCVSPPRGAPIVPALSLSADVATVTALANDVGTEAVFLRQLIAHGRRGDVAIAISTSGGSSNVLAALEEARKRGMLTFALLGYDGGEVVRRRLVDWSIVVDCDHIPRIQEIQASIYHVMTEAWQRWPV